MKKVLFIATVVKTHINAFHLPYIEMFKEKGYETVVAAKNDFGTETVEIPNCDRYVDIPFERNPFKLKNIKVYRTLKKLIDSDDFDIIHCNTPVGGVLGRLAARKARKKKNTKVIYIAHGFHFTHKGPYRDWFMFYPVEKVLSRITDALITINREDYNLALAKFKAKNTYYVRGIGVDLKKCEECSPNKLEVRKKFGIKENDILLVSIGELTKRKNHKTVIRAMAQLENSNVHYIIVGSGEKKQELKALAKSLGLEKRVHIPGFSDNVYEILKSGDIFCFPSKREGLPVALMEAMASGLPVVASKVRGNRDLIVKKKGGFLYAPDDVEGFARGIQRLISNEALRLSMGAVNRERVGRYDLKKVKKRLAKIYFSDDK